VFDGPTEQFSLVNFEMPDEFTGGRGGVAFPQSSFDPIKGCMFISELLSLPLVGQPVNGRAHQRQNVDGHFGERFRCQDLAVEGSNGPIFWPSLSSS
jgi:hypothetical protein